MTNFEWLKTLSEEEFASWCLHEDQVVFTQKGMKAIQPCPRLETLRKQNSSSFDGLYNWLKQERVFINDNTKNN